MLPAGQVQHSGIIVGRHPQGARLPDRYSSSLLNEVGQALQLHHGITRRAEWGSWAAHGPYLYGQGWTFTTMRGGMVLRVIHGTGMLVKTGKPHISLDWGDWAYVPPGLIFGCASTVVQGMNFQFVTMELQ